MSFVDDCMKKLFCLMFLLGVGAFTQELKTLPNINIWSGREQSLPFVAAEGWRVEAEHGRLLAKEQTAGCVKLSFPALIGKETAFLFVDGKKTARLAIHPVKLLDGIAADCREHRAELERLGVRHKPATEEGVSCLFLPFDSLEEALGEPHSVFAKYVVFTNRRDFPLDIRDEWTEVTVGMDKEKGAFSVMLERRERVIDNNGGGGAWIVARSKNGETFLLLPPEYDLEDVNNILFIKKELEK